MKILPKYILTVGSALSAIITGLHFMELINLGGMNVVNGVMLITFSGVIAVDYWNERNTGTRISDVIALSVVVPAFILGVIILLGIPFTGWEKLVGFMFVLLSVIMAYLMLTEKKRG